MPQILCSLVMLLKKSFLSNSEIVIINAISYISSYGIFSIGISRLLDSKDNFKECILNTLPLTICYLVILLFTNIFNIWGLDNILWFNITHIVLNGIIFTLGLFISAFYLKNKMLKITAKNIIVFVLSSILIYAIPELFVGLVMPSMSNALVNSLINGLIYSLLMWIFVLIVINYIEIDIKEKLIIEVPKKIIILVATLLSVSIILIDTIENKNQVKTINNMISYSLASGDYAFNEMDILAAKNFYEEAKNIKCAYQYAIDNTTSINGCNGDLIDLFKTLNREDSIDELKELVNRKSVSMNDLEALVGLMHESKDNEIGKVIKYLISQMHFTKISILPNDLSETEKEKLKEDLQVYDKHIIVRKYIDVYTTWLEEGALNSNVINVASKIASEYPEEVSLQAAAIKFYLDASEGINGNSGIVDNFVKLTKDKINKKDNNEVLTYKTYITYAYLACNSNEKAIKFLTEYEPNNLSVELQELLIRFYKQNREHEKAKEIALDILKKDEYNVTALSYLSIYTLQSDLDASLDYAVKLAQVISAKKDNYLDADIALGLYRVYLTGYYESPDSTFCPYQNFYNSMSEEQKNRIYDNEILNTYFYGRAADEKAIEILNKALEKYDYITYFLYYRGTYEVKNKQFDKAVQDLEKAIELGNKNPFFYSELGFAYEGAGDLKKSLEAFETASKTIDDLGLGYLTYNFNNIHNYFNVYINNAKHALYESEAHNEE